MNNKDIKIIEKTSIALLKVAKTIVDGLYNGTGKEYAIFNQRKPDEYHICASDGGEWLLRLDMGIYPYEETVTITEVYLPLDIVLDGKAEEYVKVNLDLEQRDIKRREDQQKEHNAKIAERAKKDRAKNKKAKNEKAELIELRKFKKAMEAK